MSNKTIFPHSQIVVKKSKFLGFCFVVSSEVQIKAQIAEIKAEYNDARHFVWAYRFQTDGVLKEKYTDDKEPSSSAGSAVLFLLQKK